MTFRGGDTRTAAVDAFGTVVAIVVGTSLTDLNARRGAVVRDKTKGTLDAVLSVYLRR